MMAEQSTQDTLFDRALGEIAAIVGEVMLARQREGTPIDSSDIMYGAAGMLGSAYNLAKLDGEDCLRGYLGVLSAHMQAVEDSLL